MIKPLTLLSGLVMAAAIGHTFEVKRHVAALDRELRDIRRGTEEVEARTQLLQAEWARLNDQERLSTLAERHLPGMVPMQPTQFQRLDEAVRRLPVAVAWAGPASPFAPRDEGAVLAAPRAGQETSLRPTAEAAARPAAEPAARPVVEPPARLAQPAAPTRPAEPAAAPRPQLLAEAARAPRPLPAEPATRPAPLAMAPPAQSLPPVAAPPMPRAALPAAAAAPATPTTPTTPTTPAARTPPTPQMQAEIRRPPAMAAARPADGASLPAVASPIRSAVLVQRADAGSMLGGQTSAMAPPVPYGR